MWTHVKIIINLKVLVFAKYNIIKVQKLLKKN